MMGVLDMIITATELQNNFGKYINIMQTEPVVFTKNGRVIGKLTPIKGNKRAALEKLEKMKIGLQNVDEDEMVAERAEKYHV